MPRPLGRDRLEPTTDETIVLLSLRPKPWVGREEVSPRAPVLPGTAVRWDGELYEVLSVEPRAGRWLAPRPGAVGRPVPRPDARRVRRRGAAAARRSVTPPSAVPPRSRGSRRSRIPDARTSRSPEAAPRPRGRAADPRRRFAGARRRLRRVARPLARRPGARRRLRPVGPPRLVLPVPGDGRGDLLPRPRAGAHARRLVLRLLGDAGDRHDHRLRAEPGLRGPRLGRRSSSSR